MKVCPLQEKTTLHTSQTTAERQTSHPLKHAALTFGFLLCMSFPAHAHDYWYKLEGQGYLLYRGHHHIKHGGEDIVPYDPAIVKGIFCASPDGHVQTFPPPSSYPARIPGPCTRLTVEIDSGYWTQTWDETLNQPKNAVSNAVYSWKALESTQMLNSWQDAQSHRPLSNGLEILLEKNPFVLEKGQKLRLLVMLNGTPLEGVTVAYDGTPRGVTGKDGRMNIRIRHGGSQIITGSIDEPSPDRKKADKLTRSTTLFFELPNVR